MCVEFSLKSCRLWHSKSHQYWRRLHLIASISTFLAVRSSSKMVLAFLLQWWVNNMLCYVTHRNVLWVALGRGGIASCRTAVGIRVDRFTDGRCLHRQRLQKLSNDKSEKSTSFWKAHKYFVFSVSIYRLRRWTSFCFRVAIANMSAMKRTKLCKAIKHCCLTFWNTYHAVQALEFCPAGFYTVKRAS